MKIYKNRNGEKLYPVCNAYNNQHKMEYWYTKAFNNYDDDPSDKNWEAKQEAIEMYEAFDRHIINGMVYAPYKMYVRLKEAIVCYDMKH